MQDWEEIRQWRIRTRQSLLAARAALDPATSARVARAVGEHLLASLCLWPGECLGFYWPIRGEFDLRDSVTMLCGEDAHAALPEVTARDAPLCFRPWDTECAMRLGQWNIPVPDTTALARPDVLLIPCVAVDAAGFRLGYGGGFYDRTLAAAAPRPLSIGIVQATAVLPTIHPQTHDIPLDAVLTETGWQRTLPPGRRRSARS